MSLVEDTLAEAESKLGLATNVKQLKEVELEYLGKSGKLTGLMKQIGSLPAEERPAFGQIVNQAKSAFQTKLEHKVASVFELELNAQMEAESIDVTMPARRSDAPLTHVLQQTINDLKSFFTGLGFHYYESPDLEEFKYNFDKLNYPPGHPAMDDQDTFYVDKSHVMRTQTTALQGRIFETQKPPIRAFTVGRCYRNEAVDRTHGHTFMQVDVFMVDEGVSMAHLKGVLSSLARLLFGEETKTRFRPDFFPFVEPGVDFAISTPKFANGAWLELGGAGLIHPSILEAHGIDTERYSGFAFGLGVERMPMLRYGIEDLRHFFDNDRRFLSQFR